MRQRLFINFKFFFLKKGTDKLLGNKDRCQRAIAMLRKNIDKAILIDHPDIRAITNWHIKNNFMNKDQFLWIKVKKWNDYWTFIEKERLKAMEYCGRGFF